MTPARVQVRNMGTLETGSVPTSSRRSSSSFVMSSARVGKVAGISLALLALGCSVRHVPVLELHRSDLVTPTGRVPLEIATERHLSTYRVNHKQRLIATYRMLRVRVGVLPGGQNLIVEPNDSRIAVVEGEAYYQLNHGESIAVDVKAKLIGNRNLYFDLPLGLTDNEMLIAGGTLADASVKKLKAKEDDVHTFYLPFVVNDELFAVDLEFSIGIDTTRVMAAPATP